MKTFHEYIESIEAKERCHVCGEYCDGKEEEGCKNWFAVLHWCLECDEYTCEKCLTNGYCKLCTKKFRKRRPNRFGGLPAHALSLGITSGPGYATSWSMGKSRDVY